MNLLIDCGNSFIKWRLSEGDRILSENRCETKLAGKLLDTWKNHKVPLRVIVANVAGELVASEIRKIIDQLWQLEADFVLSSLHCCDLTNSYTHPEKLGVDRWVSMIAACQASKLPAIIIDCGTAITIDLVKENGQYAGGIIMPGLYSSVHSLNTNADLPHVSDYSRIDVNPLAKSTEEGLAAGIMLGITGGIEKTIVAQSSGLTASPVVYITGGDAEKLLPHLNVHCILRAGLVLDGLSYYAAAKVHSGCAD